MTDTPFDPAKSGWEPYALSGFTDLMGPLWRKPTDDGFLFGLQVEDRHGNRSGFIHGGAMAALFDTALGTTSWLKIGERKQATITLDIQYLAPTPIGAFVVVTPEFVKGTRSVTFVRGTARIGDDIVALAQGTWKILRA